MERSWFLTEVWGYLRRLSVGIVVLTLVCIQGAFGSEYAGAFLESGKGNCGLGIAGSFTAATANAGAAVSNPASLSRTRGVHLMAVSQPQASDTVDRHLTGFAAAWNSRGGLGFGLAWLHAGVENVVARSGAGQILGNIDNRQDALIFALGLPLNDQLAIGFAVKLLSEDMSVPQSGSSSATGRGVDLGVDYALASGTHLAVTMRNLQSRISWSVERTSLQTSRSEDELPTIATVGVAHEIGNGLSVGADLLSSSIGTDFDAVAEWQVSPLLTVRTRVDRLDESLRLSAFGLTLRPMRVETVQFHFSYQSDELYAGSTSAFGLSTTF